MTKISVKVCYWILHYLDVPHSKLFFVAYLSTWVELKQIFLLILTVWADIICYAANINWSTLPFSDLLQLWCLHLGFGLPKQLLHTPTLEKKRRFWNGCLLFNPQYLNQIFIKSSYQAREVLESFGQFQSCPWLLDLTKN